MSQIMAWKEIYRDMAFSPYKEDIANSLELRDSVKTIYLYIQGQARAYEILDALRHLEYVCFSQIVRRETQKIRSCLSWEDETAREEICQSALGAIISYLERNKGGRIS